MKVERGNDWTRGFVELDMKHLFLTILFSLLGHLVISGQDTLNVSEKIPQREMMDPNPVSIDTVDTKKKKRKERVIVPKKALILSLAIPGAGQLYNGRWWKLPFVYGGVGGVVFAIDYNTRQFRRLRDALTAFRANEDHEFSGTGIDNESSLRNLRDQFDKNRQLSYIGLVAVHALQAVEAYVDAHLQNFDTDEDISVRFRPEFDVSPFGQPSLGVGAVIPIGLGKREIIPLDSDFWSE